MRSLHGDGGLCSQGLQAAWRTGAREQPANGSGQAPRVPGLRAGAAGLRSCSAGRAAPPPAAPDPHCAAARQGPRRWGGELGPRRIAGCGRPFAKRPAASCCLGPPGRGVAPVSCWLFAGALAVRFRPSAATACSSRLLPRLARGLELVWGPTPLPGPGSARAGAAARCRAAGGFSLSSRSACFRSCLPVPSSGRLSGRLGPRPPRPRALRSSLFQGGQPARPVACRRCLVLAPQGRLGLV